MSGAMLDCAMCGSRKWKDLEASHEEDLRMAGAARLFCESCTRDTYWFYSQHSDGASTAGGLRNSIPVMASIVRPVAL